MPALARKRTPAGAKAFVRYYVAVLNTSYLTHDVHLLKRASAKTCSVCAALSKNVRTLDRHGGKQVGGRLVVEELHVIPTGKHREAIVIVDTRTTEGEYRLNSHSPFRKIRPTRDIYEVHLHWSGDWYVTEMRSA